MHACTVAVIDELLIFRMQAADSVRRDCATTTEPSEIAFMLLWEATLEQCNVCTSSKIGYVFHRPTNGEFIMKPSRPYASFIVTRETRRFVVEWSCKLLAGAERCGSGTGAASKNRSAFFEKTCQYDF